MTSNIRPRCIKCGRLALESDTTAVPDTVSLQRLGWYGYYSGLVGAPKKWICPECRGYDRRQYSNSGTEG